MINEKKTQINQYPWIDWLRFLAAFVVVIAHSRVLILGKYDELEQSSRGVLVTISYIMSRLGNEAVIVFFVLSGFLVGGKAIERIQSTTLDLRSYAIDRFTRIMPPLVGALALTVVVELYLFGGLNWFHLVGNLFSMQGVLVPTIEGNSSFWSLSYEVWFYISMGAFGLLFTKQKQLAMGILSVCALVFTYLFPHYLICWLIGAVAFVWKPKKLSYILLTVSIMLVIYGVLGVQLATDTESINMGFLAMLSIPMEVARVVLSIGLALFVQQVVLLKPRGAFAKLDSAGTRLAAFSYTLYLTHAPVFRYFEYELNIRIFTQIKDVGVYHVAAYTVMLVTCFAVAIVMYYLFERNTNVVRNIIKRGIK